MLAQLCSAPGLEGDGPYFRVLLQQRLALDTDFRIRLLQRRNHPKLSGLKQNPRLITHESRGQLGGLT